MPKGNREALYYEALRCIARDYCSAERIVKAAEKHYGVSPMEALEMAYENMQNTARIAIKGMRKPKE